MTKHSASVRSRRSFVYLVQSIRRFVAKQPTARLFLIAVVLFGLVFAAGLAIITLAHVLLFDGYAANGAFQSLNPLRRLAAGEAIGNDFNFFHGIGVPLLHLPFYYLFGQGFLASEVARFVISPVVFTLTTFIVFFTFRRQWIFALTWTVVIVASALLILPFFVLPVTSMLGIRSAIPVLLLAVMLKQEALRRPLFRWPWLSWLSRYDVVAAFLLAASFLCGTEFGMAAILGFLITNTVYKYKARQLFRERLWHSVRIGGLLVVMLVLLYLTLTRGALIEPLRFALIEIPADQFWYFGVPPNSFLHLGNLLPTILTDVGLLGLWLLAIVAGFLVYRVHRLGSHRVQAQAFMFGLLTGCFGMVSMLGYYYHSQAESLGRMALLTGGLSLVILFSHWKRPLQLGITLGKLKKHVKLRADQVLRFLGFASIIAAICFGIGTFQLLKNQFDIKRVLATAADFISGTDTRLLAEKWNKVISGAMPVIQADNTVTIPDVSNETFQHGVSLQASQFLVQIDEHAAFIRPGQIVYFNKAGRQIIKKVEKTAAHLVVTLQLPELRLDPVHDGAQHKLVVAEDFKHDNSKVWSLYTGLIEAEMKTFHPSREGYDYIIHALGPERRAAYVNEFKRVKPKFVVTLSRPYFFYEEWLQNSHWELYGLIDQNYEVVKETPIYVVWQKRDQPWSATNTHARQWQSLAVDEAQQKISLPKLNLSTVPDVETYALEQYQAEQERLRAMGKDNRTVGPLLFGSNAYEQYKIDKDKQARAWEVFTAENNGDEARAAQSNQQKARAKEDKAQTDTNKKAEYLIRPKRQLILVKLKYEVSHPLENVPLFGKTSRFFLEPNNVYSSTPVSLRPYATEVTFPLVISEKNADPYLRLKTYSLLPGKGDIKIIDAQWAPLETSIANLKAFTD